MAGKSHQDIELAARVRTLTLEEIEKILKKRTHKLYGAVIVKLAGTVLPRLNELTGAGGKDLFPSEIHQEKSKQAINELINETSTNNTGE